MTSPHLKYDFAVLGGGSAGYAAARTAAALGLKTAVIDGSPTLGGLCILRGCMPSKTLIESANRFITLRRANDFGLRNDHLQVIPREIRDRKRRLIGEFADYRQEQLADGPFDLLRGSGKFLDANSIQITPLDPDTAPFDIHAKSILVATGSVIQHLNLPGAEDAGYLTSDDVLDNDQLPDSIIVLGGGAIALEMAHYFEGVGVKTTVIQRSPHVLKELDDDVTTAVEEALRHRGINLYTDTALEKVTVENGKKTVHFKHNGTPAATQADEILMALGRSPATTSLQLDQAGIKVKGPRILTDTRQATSADHIFAAGDCCGPHEIVHIAIEQGEIAATNAAVQLGKLDPSNIRTIDYRLKILGIFTEPQVATVGLTEREANHARLPILTASYPFDDHGKSIVRGETEGFVKLIAHATSGELLGGAVVGPEAVELIHEIVVAMHFHATAPTLATIPHYHPTLSEIWTYPAEEISEALPAATS